MLTIEIFKEEIGGVQAATPLKVVQPFLVMAERWFRQQVGPELYGFLAGDVETEHAELKSLALGSMSWYAFDLALPHLKYRVGDLGMMKNSPQNSIAITKWEYVDSREANWKMVDLLLESFWQLLDELRPAVWTESVPFRQWNRLFLRTTAEMAAHVPLVGRNSRFFAQLTTYIDRAERFYIRPLLTPALFGDLKEKWQGGETLTLNEGGLIEAIRPALAHLAIYEAYPYLPLVVDQNGIRQARQKDGTSEQEFPEQGLRNGQRQQLFTDGQTYLAELRIYLDSTASVSVFPSYFNYQKANQPVADDFTDKPHVIL